MHFASLISGLEFDLRSYWDRRVTYVRSYQEITNLEAIISSISGLYETKRPLPFTSNEKAKWMRQK